MDPILRTLVKTRKDAGLRVDDLAKRGGFCRNSLYQWEAQERLPTLPNIRAWAEVLGYDLVLVKREG